jgi:hypothetical protein
VHGLLGCGSVPEALVFVLRLRVIIAYVSKLTKIISAEFQALDFAKDSEFFIQNSFCPLIGDEFDVKVVVFFFFFVLLSFRLLVRKCHNLIA